MASSSRVLFLGVSVLLAVLMIAGAWFFSGKGPATPTVTAGSTDELLRAYAQKDSDSDGLNDWEEVLYGTDPNNPHSHSPDLTDEEAVRSGEVRLLLEEEEGPTLEEQVAALPGINAAPGTLTGDFALQFFGEYIASLGPEPATAERASAYASQKVATLYANRTLPDAFALSDTTLGAGGALGFSNYAASVDTLFTNPIYVEEKTGVDHFYDATVKNDALALSRVALSAALYDRLSNAFVRIAVPPEARAAHLQIANAIARLALSLSHMSKMNTDPLLAFLGISEYREATSELVRAYAAMELLFAGVGVSIPEGAPGGVFYKTLDDSRALLQP